MDYLKEFQAFAGRFSAAAEDKLAEVDGGTYNEFFRFYSRRWPSEVDNAADDEQRQINILLEELQLALESPSLLSARQGTVLHTGAVETGVGPALSQLCVALEKCLFFGAGASTPDFWWVLQQACDDDDAALATACDTPGDFGIGRREDGDTTFGGHSPPPTRTTPDEAPGACEGTPESLTSAICRLTRLHTGHARCRAWARGLLSADSTTVEGELRRAAEVAAKHGITRPTAADVMGGENGKALSVTASTGDSVYEKAECAGAGLSGGGGANSPTEDRLDGSASVNDADGGDGGSRTAPITRAAPPIDGPDHPLVSPPSDALPLWLRPGLQGASILDDLCRFMGDFSRRLEERGLSIRPSLDHAWLGQENIAAVTTYTWPRFPRERLRCYVRGAGLSLANGSYSPSELDEGESGGSLTLLGPNGCQICRQTHAAVGYDAPAATSVSPREVAPARGREVGGEEVKRTVVEETSRVLEESRTTATAPVVAQAPAAQIWCLIVPAESGLDKRSAYYSLGDGTLPPSRGWRASDAAEVPAPVLGFATHSDGDLDGSRRGGESAALIVGEEETREALFDPAVPVARDDIDPVGSAAMCPTGVDEMVSGTTAAIETSVETEAGGGNLGDVLSAGQSRRRRKRRRSPELSAVCEFEEGPAAVTAKDRHANGFVEIGCLATGGIGGSCGDSGGAPNGEARQECERFVGAGTCTTDASLHVDGDEAVAIFKAEKWALPAPSGELLLRAERTRELLRRTREERASTLATREEKLLHQLDIAQGEYQEVLRESMAATVERVLAARPGLRKEAEEEAMDEAQLVSASTNRTGQGRSEEDVPSLEELVAEMTEELRNRPHNPTEGNGSPSSTGQEEDNHEASRGTNTPPIADAGWPWPMDWLSAPRAPPGTVGVQELPGGIIFGGLGGGGADVGSDDGDRADAPPFSIVVAAVEVVDIEDPEAAHVEYVLRVLYHEVRGATANPVATSAATAAATGTTGRDVSARPTPTDDPAATELLALATAARGFLQRTRVIRKRLNSLCALHPRMMGELLEGRKLRPGRVESAESLSFPDPYELGTLEESILRIHRDKLTPRFKANTPMRKLSSQIEAYLSGVLHVLGELKAAGDVDVRARMCRALNDALSTCDRSGRKRRRGEFVLGLRIEDSTGGRFKGGDDALLRTQRRRCKGCRRTIAAEFLGMKKDYFPCRFSDALLCRSLCHNEDRRVIPHRVVHHWDFTPHRVCKDSAAFLDATHFLPVIDLPAESPRLFLAQQPLRVVRSRRKQLHSLRRAVLFHSEGQCVSGARVFGNSMDSRTHLAVNPELYSMDDLTGVKAGSLLDFLEEACEALTAHVMDECETCEARNARMCGVCGVGDPVFAFQIGTVARCPSCSGLFHTKCIRGSKRSKWWVDEADDMFVCPQCNAVAPMSDVMGE